METHCLKWHYAKLSSIIRHICNYAYSHNLARFSVRLCYFRALRLYLGGKKNKMLKMMFIDFLYLPSNETIAKAVLCDLDWLFQGQTFQTLISIKWWKLVVQKCMGPLFRFWYLPSKDIIAKVVLHDLDLLFQGKTFEKLISWKRYN